MDRAICVTAFACQSGKALLEQANHTTFLILLTRDVVYCREQASGPMQEGDQGQVEDDTKGKPGERMSNEMDVDKLAQGMSKLSSCLSESSEVPSVVGFGRRNRRKAFSQS